MLKGLVLALFIFLVFLIVHVLVFRAFQPTRRFDAMVRIMAVLGALMIAIHRLTPATMGFLPEPYVRAGWAVDLLNGLLVFGFLFIGYCMFYFLVDRGFSGRIMIEIESSAQRRLRQAEIAARYSLEMVLHRRLTEMVEIGRVVLDDGRYRNSGKGRSAAALFRFSKKFLQLGEGG